MHCGFSFLPFYHSIHCIIQGIWPQKHASSANKDYRFEEFDCNLSFFVRSRILEKKSIFESCFRQSVVSRKKRSENQPRRWEWREAILSQPFLLVLCSYCFPLLWSFPLSFFRVITTNTSTHPWRHIGLGFRWVWKDFVFVYLQIYGVDRGFSKLIYVLGRVLDVSETCKLIYFLSQNFKLNLQFKHFFRTAECSLRI